MNTTIDKIISTISYQIEKPFLEIQEYIEKTIEYGHPLEALEKILQACSQKIQEKCEQEIKRLGKSIFSDRSPRTNKKYLEQYLENVLDHIEYKTDEVINQIQRTTFAIQFPYYMPTSHHVEQLEQIEVLQFTRQPSIHNELQQNYIENVNQSEQSLTEGEIQDKVKEFQSSFISRKSSERQIHSNQEFIKEVQFISQNYQHARNLSEEFKNRKKYIQEIETKSSKLKKIKTKISLLRSKIKSEQQIQEIKENRKYLPFNQYSKEQKQKYLFKRNKITYKNQLNLANKMNDQNRKTLELFEVQQKHKEKTYKNDNLEKSLEEVNILKSKQSVVIQKSQVRSECPQPYNLSTSKVIQFSRFRSIFST